jgi:yecA family protein
VKGARLWLADDWCFGFIRAMELGHEAWDPLFDDETNRMLLVPILMLGTQEGLDEIDAAADPASEYAAAVDMLHLSVESIHTYWRLPIEKRVATRASQKPGAQRPLSVWQRAQV